MFRKSAAHGNVPCVFDSVLDNKWISRAGNASFVLGVVVAVVRIASGWTAISLATVVLLAVGVVLLTIAHRDSLRDALGIRRKPRVSKPVLQPQPVKPPTVTAPPMPTWELPSPEEAAARWAVTENLPPEKIGDLVALTSKYRREAEWPQKRIELETLRDRGVHLLNKDRPWTERDTVDRAAENWIDEVYDVLKRDHPEMALYFTIELPLKDRPRYEGQAHRLNELVQRLAVFTADNALSSPAGGTTV